MKIVRLVTTLLIAQHFGLMTGQLYDGQTVEEGEYKDINKHSYVFV